ncbi:MAG: helix-turn-helix domain-containing protein [Lachnospiraceae bacterium]|nr:helix-turn-helix domain-containing protein [Lachnospiraceae bacterium]
MIEKTLGQYLKELRKSFGYTQEFVASHLDVSRQAYSHYETGRAVPPNDTCYRIANLYSVSIDTIIKLSLPTEEFTLSTSPDAESLNDFLNYIGNEKNIHKLKYLSRKEKELLYYFDSIPPQEQDEILEILKIKLRRYHK